MLGALDDHERCYDLLRSIPVEALQDKHSVKLLHNQAYDLGYYGIAGRAARQGLTLTPYDPHYTTRLGQIAALGLKDRIVERRASPHQGLFRLFQRA